MHSWCGASGTHSVNQWLTVETGTTKYKILKGSLTFIPSPMPCMQSDFRGPAALPIPSVFCLLQYIGKEMSSVSFLFIFFLKERITTIKELNGLSLAQEKYGKTFTVRGNRYFSILCFPQGIINVTKLIVYLFSKKFQFKHIDQ